MSLNITQQILYQLKIDVTSVVIEEGSSSVPTTAEEKRKPCPKF